MIVEIGGTVGDIESLPFLEAIRQFRSEAGRGNVQIIHLTLVPYIPGSDELKTKPTQHSVQGAAQDRHPAGHPALPGGPPPAPRAAREDRPLLQRRVAGRDPGPGRGHHLRGAVEAGGGRPRRDRAREPQPAQGAAGSWIVGGRWWTPSAAPRTRSPSASSASTWTWPTPTSRLNEALGHGGLANGVKVESGLHRLRGTGGVRRIPRSSSWSTASWCPGGFGKRGIEGKIRAIDFAREDAGSRTSASASACRPRWSSSHATCAAWRAPTPPSSSASRPQGDLQDARAGGRGPDGRHHAPRQVPVPAQAGLVGVAGLRRRRDVASATGTATR